MTNNALLIYNQLRASGLSEAGALGLMGNWMAESGLEPGRLQGDFTQGRTYSRAYTDDVASGRIGRSQFGRDQKGYGLAQWTYYTRKEDLYDFWNGSGKALDDAGMQVSFAVQELSENGEYVGLWNVLKTTDDLWTAADKAARPSPEGEGRSWPVPAGCGPPGPKPPAAPSPGRRRRAPARGGPAGAGPGRPGTGGAPAATGGSPWRR